VISLDFQTINDVQPSNHDLLSEFAEESYGAVDATELSPNENKY
jgi:hypothetical protein